MIRCSIFVKPAFGEGVIVFTIILSLTDAPMASIAMGGFWASTDPR